MEYHVRSARLTDVDAAIRILLRDARDPGEQRDDADRLRSLLYLPAATVVVAEAGRQIVGVGVLSMRPSVRSGPFVGVIDELAVDGSTGGAAGAASRADTARRRQVAASMIEQLVASARNKGCARVEVADPLASAEATLLKGVGFERSGKLLSRAT